MPSNGPRSALLRSPSSFAFHRNTRQLLTGSGLKTMQEDGVSSHGIRALCPTRWTVRRNAIESIIDHLNTLNDLWDVCLKTRLDPNMKGCIIGVQTQMSHYKLLFGLHLSKKMLKITDNLSHTLQKPSMSAAEGQSVAQLTVKTETSMRSDE